MNKKLLKESKRNIETLEYDDLNVVMSDRVYSSDRFEYPYRDRDETIDFSYDVDVEDVKDALWEICCEKPEFSDFSSEEADAYLDNHYDELLDKYYREVLDYFREDAAEYASEWYDEDDYYDESLKEGVRYWPRRYKGYTYWVNNDDNTDVVLYDENGVIINTSDSEKQMKDYIDNLTTKNESLKESPDQYGLWTDSELDYMDSEETHALDKKLELKYADEFSALNKKQKERRDAIQGKRKSIYNKIKTQLLNLSDDDLFDLANTIDGNILIKDIPLYGAKLTNPEKRKDKSYDFIRFEESDKATLYDKEGIVNLLINDYYDKLPKRFKESLKEEYKTLPEFAQDDFEQRLLKIGFILDDETSLYGSKNEYRSWGHEDVNDIHYQIISKDKYTEEEFEDVVDELYELTDLFEEDYDCNITMNAGLGYDGRITAGLDIRDYWEADEGTDQVAPSKPSKLRFKNGKLADTEENEFVIQDITSHMKGITKDDIEAAAPVDKKKTESLEEEIESGDEVYHSGRDKYYYVKKIGDNKYELYEYSNGKLVLGHPWRFDKGSPFYNQLKVQSKRAMPELMESTTVDKRIKESYSNEIGSIVAHIKKVLENNKYLSFEKMIEKGDDVYLTYKTTDELIKKARPSMKEVISDSIYEISITDYIDEIDVEINVQFEFSYESLESVYIEGNDFTELDEVLDSTLSEKALLDNAENNDTWE